MSVNDHHAVLDGVDAKGEPKITLRPGLNEPGKNPIIRPDESAPQREIELIEREMSVTERENAVQEKLNEINRKLKRLEALEEVGA